MAECGESGSVRVLECGNATDRGWLRWASAEEIDALHASGDLPGHMHEATLSVYSCNDHALAAGFAEPYDYGDGNTGFVGTDLATRTHDESCRQPAEANGCGACADAPARQSEAAEVAEQETQLDGSDASEADAPAPRTND